jgi:hypothetical protein
LSFLYEITTENENEKSHRIEKNIGLWNVILEILGKYRKYSKILKKIGNI